MDFLFLFLLFCLNIENVNDSLGYYVGSEFVENVHARIGGVEGTE